MVDVRGDVLRPPHCTTPAAVKSNNNCFIAYANSKDADQPPRSLMSAFVVRCLDSIISLVSIFEISSL